MERIGILAIGTSMSSVNWGVRKNVDSHILSKFLSYLENTQIIVTHSPFHIKIFIKFTFMPNYLTFLVGQQILRLAMGGNLVRVWGGQKMLRVKKNLTPLVWKKSVAPMEVHKKIVILSTI